ncbi:hypothetical protein D0Z00_000960 [Geotrichum galactomycetum]|uniref:Uncharacterized protein n=1 Tax=Geotrichum galactomycetum TaxID=27317 RepID=A0ACB6V8C4_9ASCO|nr:hypothetical protein D0Z00_000960 [Geotrichum candidum]
MVVDYSKWDKLELSDDSDIEVHPNVDKKSFIRMKQRDIHQKREIMKQNMIRLEINNEVSAELIERLKRLVAAAEKNYAELFASVDLCVKVAQGDSTIQKPKTSPQAPTYNKMIESLVSQVIATVSDKPSSEREQAFITELKGHLNKLETTLAAETKEYHDLVEERSRHILSEDLHTGFDSTLINHNAQTSQPPASKSSSKQTVTTTEVLNPGTLAKTNEATNDEDSDEVKASPDTIRFGEIKVGDYEKAHKYLIDHPWIVNEKEKDGLIMTAFEKELAGKTEDMKRIVHNSLLIQYCATLGRDGINMFFARAGTKNHPANDAFLKDVNFTIDHIKTRCQILRDQKDEEESSEQVEQIQLYSVDPNTEIAVHVPPEDSEDPAVQEARRLFNQLDPELKTAALTCKLDEINKVLAKLSVPDAEEAVRQLDVSGVLSVEEKIYDATKWEEEKREKLAKGEFSEDLLREQEAKKQQAEEEAAAAPVKAQSTIEDVD